VSNGAQALDRGDLFGSLPWFLEALKTDAALQTEQTDGARTAENHRIRLQAVLQQCPRVQFFHHDGPITRARFSPDGSRLVTVGSIWLEAQQKWRSEARLWDLGTGRFIPLPHPDELQLTQAAFSTDGERVMTAGVFSSNQGGVTGEARVWDAVTGKPLGLPFEYNYDSFFFPPPLFSPDGRRILTVRARHDQANERLAVAGASTLGLTGTPLGQGPYTALSALLRATSEAEEARIWDLATGKAVGLPLRYNGNGGLAAAQFSPDGRRIYLCSWRWTTAGTTKKQEFEEQIWDAATGQPVTPLLQRPRAVGTIQAGFSGDGNRVTSQDFGGHVWIWDANTGRDIWHLDRNDPATWNFGAAWLSPDGRRLLTADPTAVQLWDTATHKAIGERIAHAGSWVTAFSANSRR
jgi:WD40 repeat protein